MKEENRNSDIKSIKVFMSGCSEVILKILYEIMSIFWSIYYCVYYIFYM